MLWELSSTTPFPWATQLARKRQEPSAPGSHILTLLSVVHKRPRMRPVKTRIGRRLTSRRAAEVAAAGRPNRAATVGKRLSVALAVTVLGMGCSSAETRHQVVAVCVAATPSGSVATPLAIQISVSGDIVASGAVPALAVLTASVPVGPVSVTVDGRAVLAEPHLVRNSAGKDVTYFAGPECASESSL